ncbi:MAG: tRNA pseudouridine(54/55) synthase Pus10 [Euryarchaeota archaeon]|jgi:tRNA pseudouridine synthase 10|nr:tRNA pseudouridine(54/55) synthase Pus10 [Euryarchaeota archaeon]
MKSHTLNQAKQLLQEHNLCDSCLGRLFRKEIREGSNSEKGQWIRTQIHEKQKIPAKDCWLCEGLTDEIHHFIGLIIKTLEQYEFDTFLIGSKIDEDIQEKEQQLWIQLTLEGAEPIKMEINREIGKILEPQLKKTVDIPNPDIMAIIDTAYDVVTLQISSLFIYGRYRKLQRGIPQTKWPCQICQGKGCKKCQYTGKLYETTVEELIAKNALKLTQGTDESLHGSGREDIDALMLGTGRPFVLEIKNPKKRNIDLVSLEKETNSTFKNSIEISCLRFSNREEIARIKAAEFRKIYRVTIEAGQPLNKEKLIKVAQSLQGQLIKQFTPTRVAHRRANKIRERHIYNCTIESVDGIIASLTLETESGTYIKEFVSGDNDKTQPNLSELIGIPCKVKELDVIDVKGE